MHPKLKEVRNKILQYSEIEDRVKALHNTFEDETCYIACVGPSINDYTEDYLRDTLKDKLIMLWSHTTSHIL